MSTENILYVKGMNTYDSDEENMDDEENIWDDRKLNDAYDKALKLANAEIAKRVAMATNNRDQTQTKGKCTSKSTPDKTSNKKDMKDTSGKWKCGMACRAPYDGDGLYYEACITRIINDEECVVRFIGYDNTEIVQMDALKSTLGVEEQGRQLEYALNVDIGFSGQSENVEEAHNKTDTSHSTEQSQSRNKKTSSKNKKKKFSFGKLPEVPFPVLTLMKDAGSTELPMPPPMVMSDHIDSEEQAVNSMLISWYMSGYYTGLYQGLKRAKEGRRNNGI